MSAHISNVRPKPDQVIADIADYAGKAKISSAEAYNTARLCLMDTLGCGFEALSYPACTKLMGPVVPGATMAAPQTKPRRVGLRTTNPRACNDNSYDKVMRLRTCAAALPEHAGALPFVGDLNHRRGAPCPRPLP